MAVATGAFTARSTLILKFTVTENSTDSIALTTSVAWSLQITAAGNTSTAYNTSNNSNWQIDVNSNGATPIASGTYNYDFRAPNTTTTKTIATGNKTISREAYGSYTTYFAASANGGTGVIGSASCSGSLALTAIAAPPYFPFFPYFPYFPYFPFFPFFPFFPPFFPPAFTPAPSYNDVTLPNAMEGIYYSDGVSASDATSYSIYSGSLPTGLTLDPYTGAVTGTPADGTSGAYNIIVIASGPGGSTPSTSVNITVAKETGQLFTYNSSTSTWDKATVNTLTNTAGTVTSAKNTLYTYNSSTGQWDITAG